MTTSFKLFWESYYKVAQQWDEAWHHAVRETGGM